MPYSPQNAKRLGTYAKNFVVSATVIIPRNTHFRVGVAGTYRWEPRHAFPGDSTVTPVSASYAAGEVVMCEIAKLTAAPSSGNITVYGYRQSEE